MATSEASFEDRRNYLVELVRGQVGKANAEDLIDEFAAAVRRKALQQAARRVQRLTGAPARLMGQGTQLRAVLSHSEAAQAIMDNEE